MMNDGASLPSPAADRPVAAIEVAHLVKVYRPPAPSTTSRSASPAQRHRAARGHGAGKTTTIAMIRAGAADLGSIRVLAVRCPKRAPACSPG